MCMMYLKCLRMIKAGVLEGKKNSNLSFDLSQNPRFLL